MDKEYIIWLEDVFSVVPDTTIRRMFGGVGIFRHGLSYALAMSDGRIAFKADNETIGDFKDHSCEEWSYERKDGKVTRMGYWYIPDFLVDDPDLLHEWAMNAFDVAVRADQKKPPSQRKLKGEY